MHPEALRGVQWAIQASGIHCDRNYVGAIWRKFNGAIDSFRCLDVGGADVNGSARRVVDSGTRRVNNWTGLDIEAGPGVDIVADARKPVPENQLGKWDLVLCTEVLEHVQDWSSIVIGIHDWLAPGGIALITCASTGRRPHGARGAMDPAPGEWYGNVAEQSVKECLELAGFKDYQTTYNPMPGDVYAWARRGDL